jgi:hypothetical protein
MPNDTNQKQSISTNVTKSIRLPHRVVFPWIGLSTQDKEDDVKKKDRNTLGFDLSLLVFDDNDLSNCIQTTLELLGQHSTSDHLIQSSIVYLEKKSPSTSISSSPNGGPSTNPHLSQNSIRDTDNFIGIHNKTTAVSSTLNTGLMYALFALLMLIIAVLVNFSTYN